MAAVDGALVERFGFAWLVLLLEQNGKAGEGGDVTGIDGAAAEPFGFISLPLSVVQDGEVVERLDVVSVDGALVELFGFAGPVMLGRFARMLSASIWPASMAAVELFGFTSLSLSVVQEGEVVERFDVAPVDGA